MRIFYLAGDERRAAERDFLALRARHEAALAAFRGRDWNEARAGFDVCRTLAGGALAGLYDAYADQITTLRDDSPGDDWDGSTRSASA